MSLNDVLWDDGEVPRRLPAAHPPVYLVPVPEKDKEAVPEFFRLLAEPRRVWVHWVHTGLKPKRRSMPHLKRACPWCPTKMERRAYVAALKSRVVPPSEWQPGHPRHTYSPVILDLPPECWNDLAVDYCRDFGADVPWRGMVLMLQRVGLRLKPTVTEIKCSDPLPEAFDVVQVLQDIWQVRLPHIDQQPDHGPATIPFTQKGA